MGKGLSFIAVGFALLGLVPFVSPPDIARGSMGGDGIIFPGKGVEHFELGAPAPDERKIRAIRQFEGISISAVKGNIARITVSSPRYEVERNHLRAGAPLADVLRFYGMGQKGTRGNLATLSYPAQGIEFVVDTASEKVNAITVFSPVRQRPSVEQQRKLYQYREQLKAR